MTMRKTGVVGYLLGCGAGLMRGYRARHAGGPRPLTRAAGRVRGASWPAPAPLPFGVAEVLEPRVMLDGDHPAFPVPFNPSTGTVLTLDAISALTNSRRGRALTGANEGVAGTIANGDTGDTFRFTMPTIAGRTTDFVSVLADTILAPNGTALNSTLDTYVEVYDQMGVLISVGANNGVLSSSAAPVPDGWVGFVGTAGQQYTIRVRAQPGTLGAGRTATGNYTLRVDTVSINYVFDQTLPANDPPGAAEEVFGEGNVPGTIGFRQDEVIYRVRTAAGQAFDGLATAGAIANDATILDTHLEIYDAGSSRGVVGVIASDVQAGRLTNAWSTWRSSPETTYYVRVRSDELASGRPATGDYRLSIDLAAFAIPIDSTTRLSNPPRADIVRPFVDTANPPTMPNSPEGTVSRLFQFTAQGTGVSFITVTSAGQGPPEAAPARLAPPGPAYPPLEDPAVHLYNESGVEIAFNDDFNGFTPQLEVEMVGGQRYFIVVEGFDRAVDGGFIVFIESDYTNISVDDHVDALPGDPINNDNATPIRFGPAILGRNGDGNAQFDAAWTRTGVHRGRIYEAGDTDLFQFVPEVNMLGGYGGDDGNQGQSLYVGGDFATADRLNPLNIATQGRGATNVAIWDAGDWWNAGPGEELMGLSANAQGGAPSAINGRIQAFTLWDPDGAGPAFGPSLVAAGDFTLDDGLTQIAAAARIFVPNLGAFVWQPIDIGRLPGEVGLALTTFDFDGAGPADPSLVIGGQIVGGAVAVQADGQFGTINGAFGGINDPNAVVFALATYDPPQPADPPDPDGAGPQVDPPQPPDPPIQLILGGSFTRNNVSGSTGGVANARNIVAFGPLVAPMAPTLPVNLFIALGGGRVGAGAIPTVGPNGTVLSLLEFDQEGQVGAPPADVPNKIVAGGSFANFDTFNPIAQTAATVNANNVGAYDNNTGAWAAFAGGLATPVFSLSTRELPGTSDRVVVGTGGNAGAGFVAISNGFVWQQIAATNAVVRTATSFVDDEFDVSNGETLYIGGDFTQVDGNNGFNRVAKFDDQNIDNGPVWLPLKGGVDLSAPGEVDPVSVFALAPFNDNINGVWDRNERPSSRVGIVVGPTTDSFLNVTIRIYDSNWNLVTDFIYANDTIAAPFPDPAGSINPNLAEGVTLTDNVVAPGMWAGEVYYISVTGNGTGRYSLSVTIEALPDENPDNGDGVYQDDKSAWTEVPDEGQWAIAPELDANANGDASNFDFLTTQGRQAFQTATFNITPGGVRRTNADFLASIEDINDTDLYQFRAPATGFMEIRIATTALEDRFTETLFGIHTPLADGVNNTSPSSPFLFTLSQTDRELLRTYNSTLDSLLKVFNNDFELLGENDDSRAVPGFAVGYAFGSSGRDNTFRQRDARLVIPVVAGETYFLQVESAYRATFNADPGMVDWRHAVGAYELIINSTPSSNGIDDYEDNDNTQQLQSINAQTAIAIDTSTGNGSATGVIDDVPAGAFTNVDDTDAFRIIAVSRGNLQVTVDATSINLRPSVRIFNVSGGLAAQGAATTPGGQLTLTIAAAQGDLFFIVVDGDGGTEGTYEVRIDSVGLNDDFVKDGDWLNATPLSLNAFLGTYTTTGIIENPADDDVFVFTAENFEIATVSVDFLDATLDPFVYVYEINADGEDPNTRNPAFLQIAANDDGIGTGLNSRATFSVTAGRDYYVVVAGLDPGTHFGRYQVTVNVGATDDHPNRIDFPLATQFDLTTNFDPLTLSSTELVTGNIEVNIDDDLFRFTAPATGRATISVTTPGSDLSAALFIYDSSNTLIGTTNPTLGTATFTINISQNVQYYVQVAPGPLGAGQTLDVGAYTVAVSTEPIDDFPNEGDFANPNVGIISLNSTTGVGTRTGVIVPSTDSDLFRFTSLAAGNISVRMTTVGSSLNPKIRIFNSSFVEILGATSNGDTATLTFPATAGGQVFYVLAAPNDGATGVSAVGNYNIQVTAAIVGGGGGGTPDDHADAGEFADATLILLAARDGFGAGVGNIETAGDTDLFKFVAPSTGASSVQLKTPSGGLVDGRIKIFNQALSLVGEDTSGIPGATASFNFTVTGGQTYYVLVEPVGVAIGSYTVEAAAQPVTHFLYYPEGFAGSTIDEFVPIVNPNSFAVNYSVFARYEVGTNPTTPIATGTIAPNSRGGITVSTKTGASLVDRGRPYALEIQATGQLGASLSHYDFNVSVGEAFTNQISTTWTFAQANKDRNTFRDFLLFYNPSNVDTQMTIELIYSDGTISSFSQTLGALRRGGINFDNDSRVTKTGRFGIKVTSASPIVASLSTYNLVNSGGDGLLGDANGGATAGVIPNVSTGGGVTSSLSFLNTNSAPATVTVVASYARVDLPDLTRVITVQAGRQSTITLASLGLINGQQAGIRYTSNLAVTASVIEYQNGDGNTTSAATFAAQRYVFGDLFVNPASAGITYIEKLGVYNPSATAIDITIQFLFTDGTTSSRTVNVGAADFAFVKIDQESAILSRGSATAFSLVVSSATPIVASISHYDLFLNGGWSTLGAPIGLTNAIATL